jgi:hypothetical protein
VECCIPSPGGCPGRVPLVIVHPARRPSTPPCDTPCRRSCACDRGACARPGDRWRRRRWPRRRPRAAAPHLRSVRFFSCACYAAPSPPCPPPPCSYSPHPLLLLTVGLTKAPPCALAPAPGRLCHRGAPRAAGRAPRRRPPLLLRCACVSARAGPDPQAHGPRGFIYSFPPRCQRRHDHAYGAAGGPAPRPTLPCTQAHGIKRSGRFWQEALLNTALQQRKGSCLFRGKAREGAGCAARQGRVCERGPAAGGSGGHSKA